MDQVCFLHPSDSAFEGVALILGRGLERGFKCWKRYDIWEDHSPDSIAIDTKCPHDVLLDMQDFTISP